MGRHDGSLFQVVFEGPEILVRRRWRHSQILADQFWKHFLKHYLPGLQARQKWRIEAVDLQVGDIVIVDRPSGLYARGTLNAFNISVTD